VRAQARAASWDEPVPPGLLGENLTLDGLTEDRLWIGDRLRLPGCVLAVSEPRFPCDKLNAAMGFAQAARLMAQSGFCGAYLGVLEPGELRAGDAVVLEPGPREVNLRELFRARMSGRRLPD
jgi:MOSC domain-containing protein YiiM